MGEYAEVQSITSSLHTCTYVRSLDPLKTYSYKHAISIFPNFTEKSRNACSHCRLATTYFKSLIMEFLNPDGPCKFS